ncbi:protein NDR1-like [Magnolia sinica]|uniref:protein NDR1-like n=1 Tax=Magnolia sinica TaxID=86752 RepID=UPI00265AB417|nr:protein NDR1-like [Magnolia sinica]
MLECRSFYLWMAQVLFLMGVIALLLWVSLSPKRPTYTIIHLSVPALNGRNTTLPVDDASMNTTVDFWLEITNPNNESGIYYDDINITIYFDDENVGATTISSFNQGYEKSIRPESVYTNRRFSKAVYRAVSSGTMDLKVGVATKFRNKTWGLKSKHHGMDLQGTVKIGSDGKIYRKNKKVKLHHTPKKWRLHFTGRD